MPILSTDVVEFALGQIVYRKIQPDVEGMITAIVFRSHGCFYYAKFADSREEFSCYGIELTLEKSFVAKP